MEKIARQFLRRWGVVFRDLLARETMAPAWRDVLMTLRRMEARGEIRGGRFVAGFLGEQFALPQAVELLRETRRQGTAGLKAGTTTVQETAGLRAGTTTGLTVAAADPLNLSGIITPGPRVSALSGVVVDVLNPGADVALMRTSWPTPPPQPERSTIPTGN